MDAEKHNRHMVFETSFGFCAVLFRPSPFRAVGVLLPAPDEQSLAERAGETLWGEPGDHAKARSMAEGVKDYFDGKQPSMPWPPWEWMDLGDLTKLQRQVLFAVAGIPYGQVRSYRQVAEAVGKPRASRFVGSVMAKNPFPVMIPCHRVIRSDRTVGQFGGGAGMKKKMIEMEAARVSRHTTCKQ